MSELIVVGERVLVEPNTGEQQTEAGLLLPATVTEKEKVRSGRVVKVGPGYLTPNPNFSESDKWQHPQTANRYLPLQAQAGDQAYFMRSQAIDITWEGKPMMIVPHSSILFLVRPDSKDVLDSIDRLLEE